MRTPHAPILIALALASAIVLAPFAARASGDGSRVVLRPGDPLVVAQTTSTPGPMSLELKPVVGSETIAVSGKAPAGRAVQLTLYATFSRDIPDVVLSRQTVLPNGDGAFATTVPIAPAFFRGAVITVVATTPPSGPSVSARYTVGAPNVTVPPDNLPSDVK